MADFSSRFFAVAVVATCVAAPAAADSSHWKRHKTRAPLELSALGTYSTGLGEASSEIAAYDKQTRRGIRDQRGEQVGRYCRRQ